MRVITLKDGVPDDTVKRAGFHIMDMGGEGTWLVDQDHPGYPGCVKKAIEIAKKNGREDLVEKYKKLPGWKKKFTTPEVKSVEKPVEVKEEKK